MSGSYRPPIHGMIMIKRHVTIGQGVGDSPTPYRMKYDTKSTIQRIVIQSHEGTGEVQQKQIKRTALPLTNRTALRFLSKQIFPNPLTQRRRKARQQTVMLNYNYYMSCRMALLRGFLLEDQRVIGRDASPRFHFLLLRLLCEERICSCQPFTQSTMTWILDRHKKTV